MARSAADSPATVTNVDVVVVGAGVNGIGIARDAVLRGLSVVLVEKEDICSGVSAWSGRLVHGGLRYLEQYDFALVRESLLEREELFRVAPHLVKPIPLLMPLYKGGTRPAWLIELGMIAYDILSWRKTPPPHRIFPRKAALRRFPGLRPDGLQGAVVFYDGQVELAERLCVELALDAHENGAQIITHTQVSEVVLEAGRVVGVRGTNELDGSVHEFRAPWIINAAGPWIDRVFLDQDLPEQPRLNGGTKGSHLVVDPFPGAPRDVIYYESPLDGRLVLIIPWMGRYLIGTTDIRFEEDPGAARCDIGEAEYLLEAVNALIPQAGLSMDDVLYTYSGVRPLPYVPDKAESSVQRSHSLFDHAPQGLPGLLTVVGGKLTTYRQLGQDVVDELLQRLSRAARPSATRGRDFPGKSMSEAGIVRTLTGKGAPERTARRLAAVYGRRAVDVWQRALVTPTLAEVVHPATGAIAAEAVVAVDEEFAETLADVMARRMLLAFEPGHGREATERVLAVLTEHCHWDAERVERERSGYETWLDHLALPDEHGPRSSSFGAGAVR